MPTAAPLSALPTSEASLELARWFDAADTSRTLVPSQLDAGHAARIDSLTLPYLLPYWYKILGGRDGLMQLQPTAYNNS